MATTVSQLVDAFLTACKEHRAANTHKQYSVRLRPFAAAFPDREFASLEPLEIDAYLSAAGKFADGTLKAPDTRRITAIALMQLQKFAQQKRVIKEPLFDRLEKPTGRKRERLPTAEETAQILQHASPAFRQIYQALRQSGARPSELAAATVADWDRTAGVIELEKHKTAGKTGKKRRIGVGEQLQRMLLVAIGDRTSGPIFRSPRNQPWTSAGLTQTFSRLRTRAGLPGDLVLYLARHEHATALCKAKDISAAQHALGHANIATTQRYVHPDDAALKANQDLFHAGSLDPPTPDISHEMKAGPEAARTASDP